MVQGVLIGVIGTALGVGLGVTLALTVTDLRSEEHTSELQSHHDLVCRRLLEKKTETLVGKRM